MLKLKVGWDVPLSDLKTISLEPTGISTSSSFSLHCVMTKLTSFVQRWYCEVV